MRIARFRTYGRQYGSYGQDPGVCPVLVGPVVSINESEVPMSTAQLRACILFTLGILFPSVSVADVVTDWNQSAGACVLEANIYPFAGTRVMAIVHTAMFDAINSIEGSYTSYKFKVSAPAGSSPEAAAVAAAHAALVKLFPEQRTTLDAAYDAALAQIPDGSAKTSGIAVGEQV